MELPDMVYDICRHYVADSAITLGSDLTVRVQGYIRSRNIRSLVDVSRLFDPAYHGHGVLRVLLQVEALFKKCDLFSDENCENAAKNAFLESEEVCKATNERLEFHFDRDPDDWVRERVEKMSAIIADTLGTFSDFLDELPRLVRSTNGATTTQPRRLSGGVLRLRRSLYATERSHSYLKALSTFWGYTINFRKIHHNRVEFVPKNWKTHRAIACEPEGNLALQLAFDAFCKGKLRRRLNIDLGDQSRNQRLALRSSVDGHLCTVDLKAASDRLAKNAVILLFPEEWTKFFFDTRSPAWKSDDGTCVPYHKLSSMGNGFTFTLETLVFSALCKSLGSRRFSVYGDDIIIETELYGDLVEMLSYLGFEVNEEKSHVALPNTCRLGSRLNLDPNFLLDTVQDALHLEERSESVEQIRSTVGPEAKKAAVSEIASWLTGIIGSDASERAAETYGCYRESCGVHAWGGYLITPLYLTSLRTRRDMHLLVNNIISFGTAGGKLWEYAHGLVRRFNLQLGPPVLDRGAYVFIDVATSYRLKLIRSVKRHGPYQPCVKALKPRSETRFCYDSRALFLWFLHRKDKPYESSRHSLGQMKSKSKWVRYRPVMADLTGGSVYLHWWTELLVARERCQ